MKAVISVIGKDKVGILAMIANECAKYELNVLDVTQTIVDSMFTMTMIVDIDEKETIVSVIGLGKGDIDPTMPKRKSVEDIATFK